jgi:hypothetical protein
MDGKIFSEEIFAHSAFHFYYDLCTYIRLCMYLHSGLSKAGPKNRLKKFDSNQKAGLMEKGPATRPILSPRLHVGRSKKESKKGLKLNKKNIFEGKKGLRRLFPWRRHISSVAPPT